MTSRHLFGTLSVLMLIGGCTEGETEDIQIEPLAHACEILKRVDASTLAGFESERVQPSEEHNDQYQVRISQCDHYGNDVSQRFSLVVRQDFSNRKLKPGREQLAELREKLVEFANNSVEWRDIEGLGEAAAWNGTANQLTIYEDRGHTTLAFSVYGTDDDLNKALDLAHATMLETHYR